LEAEATDVEVQIRDAERAADSAYDAQAHALREERDAAITISRKQMAELEKRIRLTGQTCETKIAEARNTHDKQVRHIATSPSRSANASPPRRRKPGSARRPKARPPEPRQTIEAMAAKVRNDSVESERLTR